MDAGLEKARAFFTRAEEVAATDNFDYAIDMYLEGLKQSPDALEDGHAPLRRLALIRQGKGGKKPSMMDQIKRSGGKTPLDQLLNAAYLLAKDPDNLGYAEKVLKACVAGKYRRTGEWIAQLIFDANRAGSKPSFATYVLLKDCYRQMGFYTQAVTACQLALELKPQEDTLQNELRDLSANMTMEKGKYGKTTDFRESIQNKEYQDRLQSQDNVVKSENVKQRTLSEARRQFQQAPTSTTNILQLAEALTEMATEPAYTEAIALLNQSYAKTKDFTFQRKMFELEIKGLQAGIRRMQESLHGKPAEGQKAQELAQLISQFDQKELEYFHNCVDNYPTDMRFKYEYGRCLIKAKQFDQAIPMLQDSRNDPRLKTLSMDKMGLCFLLKGWYEDAIDIFNEALKDCPVQDTAIAKDIRYNLARAYESSNQNAKAVEIYRKLAQTDFSYKDVSQRLDKLRNQGHNS
jgi:tetratricopeptide (TPR) repeat protein